MLVWLCQEGKYQCHGHAAYKKHTDTSRNKSLHSSPPNCRNAWFITVTTQNPRLNCCVETIHQTPNVRRFIITTRGEASYICTVQQNKGKALTVKPPHVDNNQMQQVEVIHDTVNMEQDEIYK